VIGDFSFALWDAQEQTLWCARDFLGPRPFYYGQANGLFCFSNTLDILRRVSELSRELDELFLGDFLVEGWQFDPWRTVYRDIRRLPAGHVLKFSNGELEVRRFRKLPIDEPLRLKRPEEYLDAYRGLLRDVVTDRLPEKATSLYLSGGLDSTSVCTMAAQIADVRGQKEQLKAFTVSCKALFDDPEPELAELAARHIGIKHELIVPDAKLRLFEGAETEGPRAPEPTDEGFFANQQRTFQKIAAHASVVLSGDGGDEVLTGQAWPYLQYLWGNGQWRRIFQEFGGYLWSQRRIPPLRGGFRTRFRALLKKQDPNKGFPEWLNDDFANRAALRQRWSNFRSRSGKPEHPLTRRFIDPIGLLFWKRKMPDGIE
jgi:asparagine synthase (glutamine-hydrolysing)